MGMINRDFTLATPFDGITKSELNIEDVLGGAMVAASLLSCAMVPMLQDDHSDANIAGNANYSR